MMSRAPRAHTTGRLEPVLLAARDHRRAALAAHLPLGYASARAGLDTPHRLAESSDPAECGLPHALSARRNDRSAGELP
ncbi:hypothetical protein OG800_49920 (plasmid) [Streptomyces sp. NBC_00445]|uniref:hypothetical protein n=1 Tax=Streptomyces sp. NBC_00445 TaxID=2975745 RepID=UPI002E1BF58B